MLPEVFDGVLVPGVLAGIFWMFMAGVLFKFGKVLDADTKRRVMVVLSVVSGGLVALVQVLPAEQYAQLAAVYDAVRPLLDFVLVAVLGGGTTFVSSQAAWRGYRAVVPDKVK